MVDVEVPFAVIEAVDTETVDVVAEAAPAITLIAAVVMVKGLLDIGLVVYIFVSVAVPVPDIETSFISTEPDAPVIEGKPVIFKLPPHIRTAIYVFPKARILVLPAPGELLADA